MGVTTDADVCNLALVCIGHSQFIDSLSEESTEALVAKAVYVTSRNSALERFAWKFASLRSTLALFSGAKRNGWLYAYALPTNCIAPRLVTVDGIRNPSAESRIPFDLEADASSAGRGAVDGKVLLTDQVKAELVYTAEVVSPALFSPLFVDALAWLLAAKFALGIQKKPVVALEMNKEYERALSIAFASQLRQSREDRPPDSEFASVRG